MLVLLGGGTGLIRIAAALATSTKRYLWLIVGGVLVAVAWLVAGVVASATDLAPLIGIVFLNLAGWIIGVTAGYLVRRPRHVVRPG